MRDLTRFSDPTFNPNFSRDWGHGRPRIEFGRRQRRDKKQAAPLYTMRKLATGKRFATTKEAAGV